MKNGFLLFIGLIAALGFSWAGIVLGSNAQIGALAPYYDDGEGQAFPPQIPGIAARGQFVYRDLNCASCHTQQVRRPDFGSDQARGWGDRQSVARDYIYQPWVQLGQSRIGPDLTNLAGRKPSAPDADDLMQMLYSGQGAMPAYRFLFQDRKITGQVSDHALALVGALRPAPGWEIVPTRRAEALVAYLLSLNTVYDYPESKPAAANGGDKK
jgi:cytochrome c oxidase cbb3-type subunit 2